MPGRSGDLHVSMVRPGHLLLCCAALLFCAVAHAGDWSVVTYGGRDYLTMRNVAEFYGLNDYQRTSTSLSIGAPGRSLRGTIGSNELYINGLKFILSYPIEEADGEPIVSRMDLTKIIEPVLRPSRIRNAAPIDSVVLDPGHGGYDNGATSIWGYEKTYTLDVALRARELLEAQGLQVFMTRTSDVFIPLEDRVRFANMHRTALFIAIHFNAGGQDANGIETYTLAPRGVPSMAAQGPMLSDLRPNPGNVCDAENMALACATHASLISHSRLFDRGIKRARFVVIRDITIPGVLVEGGFLTNPGDARLIASARYREEEAQCLAIAVRNYRNAVNGPPPEEEGQSVVVRDDAHISAPEATPEPTPVVETPTFHTMLPPVAEAPPNEEKTDPASLISALNPVLAELQASHPPLAAAKASPTPEAQAANHPSPRQTGSRSIVTPIAD